MYTLMVSEAMIVLDNSVREGMISREKNRLLGAEWNFSILESPTDAENTFIVKAWSQLRDRGTLWNLFLIS